MNKSKSILFIGAYRISSPAILHYAGRSETGRVGSAASCDGSGNREDSDRY
jgi:hypothetical protein